MKKLLLLLCLPVLIIILIIINGKIKYNNDDLGAQVIKPILVEDTDRCLKITINPTKYNSSTNVLNGVGSLGCSSYSNGKDSVGFYFKLPQPNYITLIKYTGGLCVSVNIKNIRLVTSTRVASSNACLRLTGYYRFYLDLEKALAKGDEIYYTNNDPDNVCLKKEEVLRCDGKGGPEALAETARQYLGRVRYTRDPRRGTIGKDGLKNLDCSSYVSEIYKCVGLKSPGVWTGDIFNAQKSSVKIIEAGSINSSGTALNNTQLKAGDLLGWKAGDGGHKIGHVVMYIGDGKIINVQGGQKPGEATQEYTLKDYSRKSSLKYIVKTTP